MAFGFDASLIFPRPTEGPTPNETLRTLSDLASARVQRRGGEATLAQLLHQRQRQDALAGIYSANADSPDMLPRELMRGGYGGEAFGAQDQFSQMASAQANREKLLRDAEIAQQRHALEEGLKRYEQEQRDRQLGETERHNRTTSAIGARQFLADPGTGAVRWVNRLTGKVEEVVPGDDRAALKAAAGERRDAAGAADDTRDLRKEINADKAVVKYRKASAELASLKELAKTSTGANDMALVFAFMKAMDPESVVRESEYSAAAATGRPDERMMGLVSRYWTGGPLVAGQRKAFIKAAGAAQSGHKQAYDASMKTYRHVAKKGGFDFAALGLEDDASGPRRTDPATGETRFWNGTAWVRY